MVEGTFHLHDLISRVSLVITAQHAVLTTLGDGESLILSQMRGAITNWERCRCPLVIDRMVRSAVRVYNILVLLINGEFASYLWNQGLASVMLLLTI